MGLGTFRKRLVARPDAGEDEHSGLLSRAGKTKEKAPAPRLDCLPKEFLNAVAVVVERYLFELLRDIGVEVADQGLFSYPARWLRRLVVALGAAVPRWWLAGAAPTLRYGPAGDSAPRLRLKASGMAERLPFGPSTARKPNNQKNTGGKT